MPFPLRSRLLLLMALASPHVVGCGDDDSPPVDGGSDDGAIPDGAIPDGSPPPSDAGPDAAPEDGGTPPAFVDERWGGRLRGRPLALTLEGRTLFVGTSSVDDPATPEGDLRGGLGRLDLDRGVLDVIEDELPRVGDDFAEGATATAGVLTIGEVTYVVAQTGLLALETTAAGTTVREVALTDASGAALSPFHLAHDATHDRLWVGTNGGLVALDPESEAIVARVGADVLGDGQTGALAVDPVHGAVFVVVISEVGATRLLRVNEGAVTNTLVPGADGAPAGFLGDVVFDPELNGVYVAIATWDAERAGLLSWHPSSAGATVDVLLTDGDLARAATGEARPFGATRLHFEPTQDLLVIGAQLRAAGPTSGPLGGGLVFAKLSTLGTDAPELYGLSTATSAIAGDHVTDIAFDPMRGRFYVALQQPCSETRLGNAGVSAIRFEAGGPVFELPWLSGVRDLDVHGGHVIAAIRDDVAGYRCEGATTQVGLVRVQSDGTGAIVPLREGGRDETLPTTRRAMTELAVHGERLAATGFRDDLWLGDATDGRWAHGPLELGISLYPQALAWESEGVLWVGGQAAHSSSDPAHLADVGPRGIARVVLGEAGSVRSHVQYVRGARDPMAGVITGLPSSEITDVIPLSNGRAFVIAGAERVRDGGSDRDDDHPVFRVDGADRLGGVALVDFDGLDDREGTDDDHTITIVAGPDELADPRAAALLPDGVSLYVLDATRGLVRIDEDRVVHDEPLPLELTFPHFVHTNETSFAVGGAEGSVVSLGAVRHTLVDHGHAWTALPRDASVLYLGTDEGVVRLAAPGGTLPTEPAAPMGEAVPFVAPRR